MGATSGKRGNFSGFQIKYFNMDEYRRRARGFHMLAAAKRDARLQAAGSRQPGSSEMRRRLVNGGGAKFVQMMNEFAPRDNMTFHFGTRDDMTFHFSSDGGFGGRGANETRVPKKRSDVTKAHLRAQKMKTETLRVQVKKELKALDESDHADVVAHEHRIFKSLTQTTGPSGICFEAKAFPHLFPTGGGFEKTFPSLRFHEYRSLLMSSYRSRFGSDPMFSSWARTMEQTIYERLVHEMACERYKLYYEGVLKRFLMGRNSSFRSTTTTTTKEERKNTMKKQKKQKSTDARMKQKIDEKVVHEFNFHKYAYVLAVLGLLFVVMGFAHWNAQAK